MPSCLPALENEPDVIPGRALGALDKDQQRQTRTHVAQPRYVSVDRCRWRVTALLLCRRWQPLRTGVGEDCSRAPAPPSGLSACLPVFLGFWVSVRAAPRLGAGRASGSIVGCWKARGDSAIVRSCYLGCVECGDRRCWMGCVGLPCWVEEGPGEVSRH